MALSTYGQTKARRQQACKTYISWVQSACDFANEPVPAWTTAFKGPDDINTLLHKAGTAQQQGLMGCQCWGRLCQMHLCTCPTCTVITTSMLSIQRAVPYGAHWVNTFHHSGHLLRSVKGIINEAYSHQAQVVLCRLHASMGTAQLRHSILSFATPIDEDVLSIEVCCGFIVRYLCERALAIPDTAFYRTHRTKRISMPAPRPGLPRDRYVWTNPLWFGKGIRCRGPHVDGSSADTSNRYCCCMLIEISIKDGRSASSKTVIAHRFSGKDPLGTAMQQIFDSDVWQPYKGLQVYFAGCSTEVMRMPGTWEAGLIGGDFTFKMVAAAPADIVNMQWPAFRSEHSRVGDDRKIYSISNIMGKQQINITREEYLAAAQQLYSATTPQGERVFQLTEHFRIFTGGYTTHQVPYSPDVNEGIALTDTLMWKRRVYLLWRYRFLHSFEVHLSVKFSDAFRFSIVCDKCIEGTAGDFISSKFECPQQLGAHILCVHGEDDPDLQDRLELARLADANYRLEQELGDDFQPLMDFRDLRDAMLWHYARVLRTLYGHVHETDDLTPVWPMLNVEHIASSKKQVLAILKEWFALRPGLSAHPWMLELRAADTLRNAFTWERKRQSQMGGGMQKIQGEKLPHMRVPGVLSKLDNVHTFLPCVKRTLAGAMIWNKAAFR
ncbi:hypothetical protein JKP88DRAFT_262912 [Tribonema minus]|uniref:Uncharacterized protein n=1 Tax=Tribonema minus TaxID=303371 RepID=A0A836CG54_9STRA|nr:hypothetical protein JKP88DRAFT_262912 [Tribonema minus]